MRHTFSTLPPSPPHFLSRPLLVRTQRLSTRSPHLTDTSVRTCEIGARKQGRALLNASINRRCGQYRKKRGRAAATQLSQQPGHAYQRTFVVVSRPKQAHYQHRGTSTTAPRYFLCRCLTTCRCHYAMLYQRTQQNIIVRPLRNANRRLP